jgi:hypothetical protein
VGKLNRRQFDAIMRELGELNRKVDMIMGTEGDMEATIDDLVAEVAAEKDFDASVATFIAGLETQLTNAGADQAKIQAVFDGMIANKATLAAALVTPGPGPTA